MKVPIDRTAWSTSSQRTAGHYDELAQEYEGIRCPCRGCEKSFVLTAAEQQHAYEVEKKYVWWRPTLCSICRTRLADLRGQDQQFQVQWNASSDDLKGNRAFVTQWLAVLREISKLAKSNSMQTHLERLL